MRKEEGLEGEEWGSGGEGEVVLGVEEVVEGAIWRHGDGVEACEGEG